MRKGQDRELLMSKEVFDHLLSFLDVPEYKCRAIILPNYKHLD
jgi:hypothetical protein